MKKLILPALITSLLIPTMSYSDTYDSRVGKLEFTKDINNGYPTEATAELLYKEMDFQRATQAYLWATPYVSFLKWQESFKEDLGLKNGEIILQESYKDKLGGLTYNTTTPYALTFVDVDETPWIMEIPEGGVRGSVSNMWQIGIKPITKAGKYLLVGPESVLPENVDDYILIKSDTNTIMTGVRLMATDPAEKIKLLEGIKIYPISEIENPQPRGYIETNDRDWMAAAPRGIEYFELLSKGINTNGPIHERDRLMMGALKSLGIEKGKEFNPTKEQAKILEEAALVGEAMAKTISYNERVERLDDAFYVEDSKWNVLQTSKPNQRRENYDDFDGRVAYFYEAVTNDIAMHGMTNGGWGQVYLSTHKDNDDDWLDGEMNYKLTLPSKPPVDEFWSITLYEVDTRTIINNKTKKADLSSRHDLKMNADGSIDLYFGPTAPAGLESNWVQTESGRNWFPYFRFYSPKEEVVSGEWVLPNIEKNTRL
tara:strand:+ start:57996 stop:59447 length:1452 start_codon:yes stop_codon:yes gene_type:complete